MQRKKYIFKRKLLLISFTLMLVFSLATITFSWYRNYVEVTGPEITTGHINVNMNTYYVNNNVISEEFNKTINENTYGNVVLNSGIQSFLPDENTHMYYFFENPGTDNSIDLEVLLSMDIEGLYTNYEVSKIGGLNITLDNETADFKDWVTQKYPSNPTFTEARFEAYIKDTNVSHTGGDTRNFLELEKAMITGSVNKNDVLCIRVTVSLNEAITIGYLNKQYPLRMSLCVAQEGGLPGLEKVTTFYASTLSSLNAALNLYKPNDKIIITDDIDYVGDLIINRPVEIYVQDSTLNIHGNFMFSYSYPGSFLVNTAQSGKICVYRINNAGGDFEIDVPNSSIELIGRNNSINGNADIYVQRNMTVTASEDVGVILTSSRICETVGEDTFLDTLKDIELGNHTRVEVGSRTNVGNLHSESSIVRIRNNGTINEINLKLLQRDTTYVTSPNIFIDNYSSIAAIYLPDWSSKFVMTESEDPSTGEPIENYAGNTRIVSNMGATFNTITCLGDFKYDGSKDPAKDDVEYVTMSQFVEAVNGDKTDVIVHYTRTEIKDLENDNTLQGIMKYYIDNGTISPLNEIKKLKIITYSGSFLTSTTTNNADNKYYDDDYEYIRENMTSLTELDLSEAASVNYIVPAQAFLNLNNLVHVDMSETDTSWEDNIFQGTSVVEIKIPASVISITSNALYNIKYIHTDYKVINNVIEWWKKAGIYLFVPDQTTFDAYLAKYNGVQRIFLEATRYSGKLGDYFFRINETNKTFEVATLIPATLDLYALSSTDFMFNFDTIVYSGEQYKLTKIDNYAFNAKAFTNSAGSIDLIIGDAVEVIGDYAFKSCSGIVNLKLLGPTRIQQFAFQGIGALVKVEGELVPFIGTQAFGGSQIKYFYAPSLVEAENYFLQGNRSFKVVEVGMVADTSIKFFGSATVDTVIIHTDCALAPELFTTKINLDVTLTTLIVNENYESIWKTSYPNIDIISIKGSTKNDLIRVGADIFPEYFYSKNENNELTFVKTVVQKIDGNNQDYIVPTVSKIDNSLIYTNDDPNAYPLVEIGMSAFKYTELCNIRTLSFLDNVKKIGNFAFAAKSTDNKTTYKSKSYEFLDLNNVEEIGESAFNNNTMVDISAPHVVTASIGAFYYCSNAFKASLPKLKNTTGNIFTSHTGLRFLLLGPCDGTMNGVLNARNSLALVIVDATTATNIVKTGITSAAYPLIVVGGNTSTATDIVIESFENLYFSDFYTHIYYVNDKEYQFEVPSYAYYSKNGKVILGMAIAAISDERYTIPSEIYPAGEVVSFLGKNIYKYSSTKPVDLPENTTRVIATRVGNYSLKYVTYNVDCYLTLGDNFLELGEYACNSIALKGLDVNNVTTMEQHSLASCKISQFKGDKVQEVRNHVFAYMPALEVIHLPSAINIGNNAFRGGSNGVLKEVLFGENLANVTKNAFEEDIYLESIYIFSLNDITGGTFFINCSNLDKTIVYVNESRYDYFQKATFLNGISKSNILTFEKTYTEEATGLSYLLSDLGDGKARMEKVIGLSEDLIGNTLTIPSTFTVIERVGDEVTYQQDFIATQIGSKFLSSLNGITYITKLILPVSLEVFDGNGSLLIGSGINEIEISEENTKFATEKGVLYSKDMSTLIMYPIGKQEATFTLSSQVKTIYEYAFTCNQYLTNIIIPNKITILNGAFKDCTSLSSVTFNNEEASLILGKDIFYSTGSNLVIYVPSGSKDSYIANIIFDLDIIDLLQEQN